MVRMDVGTAICALRSAPIDADGYTVERHKDALLTAT